MLGATLLVFVFALGFFVTPAILGGGRSVMIAELIYLNIFQISELGTCRRHKRDPDGRGVLADGAATARDPSGGAEMNATRPGRLAVTLAVLVALFLLRRWWR